METRHEPVARLKELDREARHLAHAAAVISWDQQTYMPKNAVEGRAQQQALLEGLHHARITDPEVGTLLAACGSTEAEPSGPATRPEIDRAFLRAKEREYRLSTRLPGSFVREMAELTSRSQAVWAHARADNDFALFRPHLEKIVEMTIRMADYLGYEEHPYDALLDQYEPYMRSSEVKRVFDELQTGLVPLVAKIGAARQVDDSFLHLDYPLDRQEAFSKQLMVALGYDIDRGRLDTSTHPFTTTLGSDDVRITTRYHRNLLQSSIFSTIHETGHALYEQGFGEGLSGTLLAEGTSLGIHESQSRMWENTIGRSEPFWSHWLPTLQEIFPEQLSGVSVEQFYRAVNKVEPSFIRVEADEVTYGLHVILRYRMEMALISGELKVADAPEAWRELSRELLGIVPETDRDGILQDVHWSFGGIGYFPTYALGNLYAAQFFHTMERQIPQLRDGIARGETGPILEWLRENIHRHGSSLSASELVRRITGEPLSPQFFLAYLNRKYGEIYTL